MTHAELVQQAKRWLLRQGCGFVFTELVAQDCLEIPDAIGWKGSRTTILVECKVSHSDFLADGRKLFRRDTNFACGNLRYYLCPPDIINVQELPAKWGLLYCFPNRIMMRKKAEQWRSIDIVRNERPLLFSALRRVHLRGDLDKIYEPLVRTRRRLIKKRRR